MEWLLGQILSVLISPCSKTRRTGQFISQPRKPATSLVPAAGLSLLLVLVLELFNTAGSVDEKLLAGEKGM